MEAYATLKVQSYGPAQEQRQGGGPLSTGSCRADERACANAECIKAEYMCDGEPDCRDRLVSKRDFINN